MTTLKSIALELLQKYEESETSVIWEYSGDIEKSEKYLDAEVTKYRELINKYAEQEQTNENLHREREQAYMQGYEDASKKYRQEPCDDTINRQAVLAIAKQHTLTNDYEAIQQLPAVRPQQEIVRCSQCKYAEVADSEDSQDGYTCQFHRGSIWFSGSYCSWAERRQDG